MSNAPSAAELRVAIPWVDGHADIWRLFADGALLCRCVRALVRPYENDSISHVAGVESRGFLLGAAAATTLGVGFVAIRKDTGHFPGKVLGAVTATDYKGDVTRLRLQVGVLPETARVLVVDDWLETGSQFRAARALLEGAGAAVVGTSVIVNQIDPALRLALGKFRYLVDVDDLTIGA